MEHFAVFKTVKKSLKWNTHLRGTLSKCRRKIHLSGTLPHPFGGGGRGARWVIVRAMGLYKPELLIAKQYLFAVKMSLCGDKTQ